VGEVPLCSPPHHANMWMGLSEDSTPLESYHSPMPRVLGGPRGVGVFLWARHPFRPARPGRARLGITLEPLRGLIRTQYPSHHANMWMGLSEESMAAARAEQPPPPLRTLP